MVKELVYAGAEEAFFLGAEGNALVFLETRSRYCGIREHTSHRLSAIYFGRFAVRIVYAITIVSVALYAGTMFWWLSL